ncbi:hypothetical protein D3C75_1176580 [compost metagenome]
MFLGHPQHVGGGLLIETIHRITEGFIDLRGGVCGALGDIAVGQCLINCATGVLKLHRMLMKEVFDPARRASWLLQLFGHARIERF